MKLVLGLLFAFGLTASAAITEKYVTSAGAGSHDGSDEANAFSWAEMVTDINAGSKAGNRYNVKGTISRTSNTDTISGSGAVNAPIVIRGYSSTIADGYQGRSNGNGALVTSNMPLVSYTSGLFQITGGSIIFETINFSSTRGGNGWYISGAAAVFLIRCNVSMAASSSSSVALYQNATSGGIIDSDITQTNGGNAGTEALYAGGGTMRIIGCRITSASIAVITGTTATVTMIGNTIYGAGGVAFSDTCTSGIHTLVGNTIASSATNAVQFVGSRTVTSILVNNCITDNSGFGVQFTDTNGPSIFLNTRTRDNTAGATSMSPDWWTATNYSPVTTDTGGPEQDYINAAAGDYRLILTSPARAAGLPLYRDIGALQHREPGTATPFVQ